MAWIESHQSLRDHPKVIDLMNLMGWDLDTTIGKLHRFWWWCVDYSEDGDLRRHNDGRLGAAVGVLTPDEAERFVEAMVAACWLDRDPYFRVHDWWDYIGRWLQSKYKRSPEKWEMVRNLYKGGDATANQPTNQPTNQPKPTNLNQPTKGQAAHAFLTLFHEKYLERWKQKPTINTYDVKNLQRLVEGLVNGDAERIIEVYFNDPAYVGHSLQGLYQAKTWDRMRGRMRGEVFGSQPDTIPEYLRHELPAKEGKTS